MRTCRIPGKKRLIPKMTISSMKTTVAQAFFLEKKVPAPHPSHILNQKTRGLGRTHRGWQMEGWSRETLQNIDVRQQSHL